MSLLLAAAVISSAVFLHESHYFNSSESHVLEVLRGMDGKSEVRSWDDDRNLKRRETLLQKRLCRQSGHDRLAGAAADDDRLSAHGRHRQR